MVIRLNKLHALMFAVFAVVVSFCFAIKSENSFKEVSSVQNSRSLPIVMYHHITENSKRAGKYVVTKNELESDLEYIKSKGYTTVTVNDLQDYMNAKTQLPEKIIMITFDDGFESVYRLAMPLLKERNMKAVIFPVGSITETYTQNGDKNINYAYMTWQELSLAQQSDVFEVQSHTYDMHYSQSGKRKGLSKMNGESENEYRNALKEDLQKMQNLLLKNSGINATCIAYPYGAYSSSTQEIVKELGFSSSLVCEERINTISRSDSGCLYNLGRYNRASGITSEEFFSKLIS